MMTLKARLIGAAALWIIRGLIVAGVLLSAIFRRHVTMQFYNELHVHLEELQRLVRLEPDGAHLDRHLSDPRYDVPNSGYYWEVKKDGRVLSRSPSLRGALLRLPDYHASDVEVHHHRLSGPTGTLLVAERAIWPSAYSMEHDLSNGIENLMATILAGLAGNAPLKDQNDPTRHMLRHLRRNHGIAANDSIKSFVFLAVPLLVITGEFLTEGGISRKLIAFSRACVGFMNGATASTAMFSCGLFAAISGSNAATAATMGRLLGPEMIERKVKPASPERSSPPPAVRSA
ncbi:MAG: TRAP transporter large permease subunit [Hyphomicrobiaceae bacterium]